MSQYYSDSLSAERLRRCYEIAPPRVVRYLEAEIEHVLTKIKPSDTVLELGCGYGRVIGRLLGKARKVVGIDTSKASLDQAKKDLRHHSKLDLAQMNAVKLGFTGGYFDVVICVQNGMSAFKVDQENLILESLRVTRDGGTCLFSSYSDRFWEHRLEWFHLQASEGLIGEIDLGKTGNGCIVCKDGFQATTLRREDFYKMVSRIGVNATLAEVDESSIFCEIRV
ncbi:MAG: methyltransferase domain-containing protein [Candidatus Thorarchaeota archaeon]|nr:methyltransferase domain-containing protein [Candidatus Thorarchaeota archaeon]